MQPGMVAQQAKVARARRAEVGIKIGLKLPDRDAFAEHFSQNISRHGIFIRANEAAPVGSRVHFEYRLADGARIMRGVGIVRWVRSVTEAQEPGQPPGMGIEFIDLDRETEELISRIVARFGEGSRAPKRERAQVHLPPPRALGDDANAAVRHEPEADSEVDALLGGLESARVETGEGSTPADASEWQVQEPDTTTRTAHEVEAIAREVAQEALAESANEGWVATEPAAFKLPAAAVTEFDVSSADDSAGKSANEEEPLEIDIGIDDGEDGVALPREEPVASPDFHDTTELDLEALAQDFITERQQAGGRKQRVAPADEEPREDADAGATGVQAFDLDLDTDSGDARLGSDEVEISVPVVEPEAQVEPGAQVGPQEEVSPPSPAEAIAPEELFVDLSGSEWHATPIPANGAAPQRVLARAGRTDLPAATAWLLAPWPAPTAQVVAGRLGLTLTPGDDEWPALTTDGTKVSVAALMRDTLAALLGGPRPKRASVVVPASSSDAARRLLTLQVQELGIAEVRLEEAPAAILRICGVTLQDFERALVFEVGALASHVALIEGAGRILGTRTSFAASLAQADCLAADWLGGELLRQHRLDVVEDPSLGATVTTQVQSTRASGADHWSADIAGAKVALSPEATTRRLAVLSDELIVAADSLLRDNGTDPTELAAVIVASEELPWAGLLSAIERVLACRPRLVPLPLAPTGQSAKGQSES
jgi:uncharacterized protein (TIGR02266 family)